MLALLPILSEEENNEEFLDEALKGVKEAIVLIVVDASNKEEFGFATSQIQKARIIMEKIKTTIGTKRKKFAELMEWGDTKSKILNIALLKRVDKVILKKQENQYFDELVKELKKEKIEVQII